MKKFFKIISSIVGSLALLGGLLALLDRIFYNNSSSYEYISCNDDDNE